MKAAILSLVLLITTICKAQPTFQWARSFNSTAESQGQKVVTDALGNVYTTGIFSGTTDFDPGPGVESITPAGNSDAFISKLDAAGNFVWAKIISGPQNENGYGLAVDATGNVYITGSFWSLTDFDPGAGVVNISPAGLDDIFICKLDADGDFVWVKTFGNMMSDYGNRIEITATSDIQVKGGFSQTVDFDPGPATQVLDASNGSTFILNLDADGNFVSVTQTSQALKATAVDADGNVYTTGSFSGTVDFDPGPGVANLTSAGNDDIYISKFDVLGNFVWVKKIGGSFIDMGYSIQVDIAGNVYTVGLFSTSGSGVDFDPGPASYMLTPTGIFTFDIFLLKLDASGNFIWAQGLGSSANEIAYSLAVVGPDDLYITGEFAGTTDFDPSSTATNDLTPSSAQGNIFVAHYAPISLPLTLLQFQAENAGNTVQLHWQTAQEENTGYFSIERSADGKLFTAIGSVAAVNNSSLKNNYTFIDGKPVSGTGFYRLKMMDIDGKYTYSQIVSARRDDNGAALLVAPNPAKDILYVQAKGNDVVTVQISDVNGRILQQQKITLNGNTSFSVNIQQLPAGNYYLLVNRKELKKVQGFVKQ